jgi:hypothetical protein
MQTAVDQWKQWGATIDGNVRLNEFEISFGFASEWQTDVCLCRIHKDTEDALKIEVEDAPMLNIEIRWDTTR